MTEGFGGVAQLIDSFDDRQPSKSIDTTVLSVMGIPSSPHT
jgi:hypothetical protein